MPLTRKYILDALERVAFTFLEAFLGIVTVAPVVGLSTLHAAAAAGVASAFATVKTLLAGLVGQQASASLLPTAADPTASTTTTSITTTTVPPAPSGDAGLAGLLVLALLLIILFGGLGFAAHILWLGLILGVVLLIASAVAGRG